jgi:hypothetical protein
MAHVIAKLPICRAIMNARSCYPCCRLIFLVGTDSHCYKHHDHCFKPDGTRIRNYTQPCTMPSIDMDESKLAVNTIHFALARRFPLAETHFAA